MPFNVLLLPLLGGYVFITYWNRTRFAAKRISGERLIFHSAFAGIFFLLISYVITRLLIAYTPGLAEWWHREIPFDHSGTSFLAFALAGLVWFPLNWFFDLTKEVDRTINKWNDYLEILLHNAAQATTQVAITLKTGKVYIGFVTRTFDPAYDRKYIVVLPTMSGYRDKATHLLTLNTDYTAVYQQLMTEDESRLVKGVDDFQVVVPVAEILSANGFDWDAYTKFNPSPSTASASAPASP